MSLLEGFPRASDVAEMRKLRADRLVHRAIVIRVVAQRADLGFTHVETRIASNVPVLLQPNAESLQTDAASQEVAIGSYVAEADAFAPILAGDRLYVTGKMNGAQFAKRVGVTSTNVPRAHGVAMKMTCSDARDLAGEGPPPT